MEPQTQPLVCPSHTTQYIGVLVVGILVGTGASFIYFKQALIKAESDSYQIGFIEARKLVEESSIGNILKTPDDIRTLSGTVKAVNSNRVTFDAQALNPFDSKIIDERTVTITADTNIFKISQKDTAVLQKEIEAIMKNVKKGTPQSELPDAYMRSPLEIGDIKVGSKIIVTSIENIKTAKDFLASEIQVQ